MLTPWLDLPDARATVQRWSERTGLDLLALGTTASADEVRPTQVAQPLLTAVALLSGRAVLGGSVPTAVCGHSIGELSALALAGVMTDDDAVALAAGPRRPHGRGRGRAPDHHGGRARRARSTRTSWPSPGLEVATINVPGQVVVGGTVDALQAWTPPAGARVRPLDVAGRLPHLRHGARRRRLPRPGRADRRAGRRVRRRRQRRRRRAPGRPRADGPPRRAAHPAGALRPVPAGPRRAGGGRARPRTSSRPAGVLAGMAKRTGIAVTAVKTPADLRPADVEVDA
jgi:[acyl-carrier-protein] S-malonyltransferase